MTWVVVVPAPGVGITLGIVDRGICAVRPSGQEVSPEHLGARFVWALGRERDNADAITHHLIKSATRGDAIARCELNASANGHGIPSTRVAGRVADRVHQLPQTI
jgi:hypothetical protein